MREWRARNLEHSRRYQREYHRQYRVENSEKLKSYKKDWKAENREKVALYMEGWRARNRERSRFHQMAYKMRKCPEYAKRIHWTRLIKPDILPRRAAIGRS